SIAAYAVAASKCDGSTPRTSARAAFGMPGTDASCHVLPASRVTLICPLFVPTHSVPWATVDAPIDSIAPPGGAAVPGAVGAVGPSERTPRSGLIAFQCAPPSVVAHT